MKHRERITDNVYSYNKKAAEAASINHNFFIIVIIKMKNLPMADDSKLRLLSTGISVKDNFPGNKLCKAQQIL